MVIAGIAWVLVAFVFNREITGIEVNSEVIRPDNGTVYTNRTALTLGRVSKNVKHVDWAYSTDNGVTYTNIASKVAVDTTSWSIPEGIYSNNMKLQLTDSEDPNRKLTSRRFRVVPHFDLVSGTKTVENYIVPNEVKIAYRTNCSLITSENLKLQISVDGVTFTPPPADDRFQVFPTESYVSWRVTSHTTGKYYVRLITDNLVGQGYPDELQGTTINQLRFVANGDNRVTSAGNVFDSFEVYATDPRGSHQQVITNLGGDLGSSWMSYGETIYFRFGLALGSDPLKLSDVQFSYQIEGTSTWITMSDVSVVSDTFNIYSWVIPSLIDGTISFKVEQTNSNIIPPASASIMGLNVSNTLHLFGQVTAQHNYEGGWVAQVYLTIYSTELYSNEIASHGWSAKLNMCDGSTRDLTQKDGTLHLTVKNQLGSFANNLTLQRLPDKVVSFVLTHTYQGRATSTKSIEIPQVTC